MSGESSRSIAVLIGNGLSTAFNSELNLQRITEEVLNRMSESNGDDVVAAMREIAERTLPDGANTDEDFELLVGAFGTESRTLGTLDLLAQLTEPKDVALRSAIATVADFTEQVRDNGVSHVLEVITERSHATQDDAKDLNSLVSAVVGEFKDDVVFANLNYDTLLLASLLAVCPKEVADMGHGWKRATVQVGDQEPRQVQRLRASASDFPGERRILLLHMHGSLTYWTTMDGDAHVKVPRDMLLEANQWSAIRNRSTNIRPDVVLASRRDKTEHVSRFPFSLAYEMFAVQLATASRWLIIGYSFRDDPVNEVLRKAFMDRVNKPQVLVVTYGEELERLGVERAFGWGKEDGKSDGWLTINRGGADGAENTSDWKKFVEPLG
ncbi:SIR2 family protein [Brevibacterium aurantiacum]|uniref:Uncharacterized protein n=1 Tax=Brevibacterium aurantiacum TaxID=273384 RepID=A0A3T0DRJ2_BREAU|nr:SIR2 family protein [Brevibacterium aurantiacum]AZT97715.1 hypothetical protein CXR27_12455 [Brevibacterium aurantiacum]